MRRDEADRWLRENDPEYGSKADRDLDAYTGEPLDPVETDMYDVAPTREQSDEAVANLFESGDYRNTLKARARPKGKRRITAAAVLRRGGEVDGLYLAIHNDEEAIAEYLERVRPLEEYRRALQPHRPPMGVWMLRHELGRRIRELYAMGAHECAIARVLECQPATVRRLAGSPRERAA